MWRRFPHWRLRVLSDQVLRKIYARKQLMLRPDTDLDIINPKQTTLNLTMRIPKLYFYDNVSLSNTILYS